VQPSDGGFAARAASILKIGLMAPEISVVIPTHKRQDFLRRALDSVHAATKKAKLDDSTVEIIVVDDGHDKDTETVCEQANGPQLPPVIYAKGSGVGPAKSRNQGTYAARGKYIFFLDDDDQFLPNRFDRCLELLRSGRYDAVLEKTLRIPMEGSGREPFLTGPADIIAVDPFTYLFVGGDESHITPGATSFTKDIFLRLGRIDERICHGEDGEFLLRVCAGGRVALVGGEPVAITIIHGDNMSRPDRQRYWHNIKALKYLIKNLKKIGCHDRVPFVKQFAAGKFDYTLSQLRFEEPRYFGRLSEGAKALFYYPLECLTLNNLRTICVFLVRSRVR